MRRIASTASAMTSAFWSLAMGPGDFTHRGRAEGGTDVLVVDVTAGVVADDREDVLRHDVDAPQKLLDGLLAELGVLLEGGVRVRHVCGVVLVVMDLHRLGVDVRLEGIERIRKLG